MNYEQAYNVFFDGVTATHLRLPLEIHNRVKRRWTEVSKQENTSQNYHDSGDARLHIVWLIGRLILKTVDADEYQTMESDKVSDITSRIDDWFLDAYSLADDAVQDTIEYYIREDAPEQVTGHYEAIIPRHTVL